MLHIYQKKSNNNTEQKNNKKTTNPIMNALALILVIIGAINWGSIGLFGLDLVGALFGGQMTVLSRIIFTIVGLAGLWSISFFFSDSPIVNKDN